MRRFFAGAIVALTLPLAGCFDADVTADFTDTDAVALDAVMTMGADIYQMASSMGEDPCKEGLGTENPDGTYTCAMLERRSLDALLAAMDDPDDDLGIGMGDGVAIARLDNGNVSISFDLSEMTRDLPPPEERAQVAMMFGDAFNGHAITMRVVGKEIVETNGEIVDDGRAAQLIIPLQEMFSPSMPDIPESFFVTLVPGN